MAGIQEAIRIVLETEGREGIEQLRAALSGLGGASADSVDDTNRLLDSLADLNDAAAKLSRFDSVSADLRSTTEALDDASRAALQLALQIGETDKPSKEMVRTYKQVRDEVTRLERVQQEQATTQGRIAQELRETGIETADFAQAEALLRSRVQAANQSLTEQVQKVQAQADAARRQREALLDGEEAFRRFARSGQVSAEALERYRERAAAAATSTTRMGEDLNRSRGIFGSIKTLVAGAAAYLSFDAAVSGIKRLAEIGSQAETTRRALGNLYGSQAAGNVAFDQLRAMASRNGVALNDLADTAKKLKAFGLDPLKGSLQALLDQNAAVGGSQQDLEGKVLALGQAWAKQKLQGEEILQLVERGVPVWDLLQKATGKNVDELQKLSAAGDLGRDVIQKLYEEIGRANAGAAQAGLSSLSGLMQQASARWTEFVSKVADAGVTDYFKAQIQSLLTSTGGLDSLARTVAGAITGALDGVKSFASEIATLARPLAEVTLWLAKHGEALSILAKLYVATKITQFANGLTSVAVNARSAAVATTELAAAEAARSRGIAGLGRSIGGIPGIVKTTFLAIGIETLLYGIDRVQEGLDAQREAIQANQRLQFAESNLKREQLALGQRLQALNRDSASVAIASAGQLKAMTAAQSKHYLDALQSAEQFYAGAVREARALGNAQAEATAVERWKALGAAIVAATQQLKAAESAASGGAIGELARQAAKSFDDLIAKGKTARDAVNGVFDGIDFSKASGMEKAGAILEEIAAKGGDAGRAIQAELREVLLKLANEDLPRVQGAASYAFDTGAKGAAALKKAVDEVDLAKLGVDVEAIKTGFTETGRAVVDSFDRSVTQVERLGLTAQQKSQAIAAAFDNAFRQASTKSELEALRASLQRAMSEGSIGFTDFQARIGEVNAKLRELAGTGASLGKNMNDGASEAAGSLDQLASAAEDVADKADSAKESTDASSESMKEGAKEAGGFALTLGSVSDEFTRAAMGANRFVNSINLARFANQLNRVTDEYNAQFERLQQINAEIDKQLASFDPLNKRVEELRSQYTYLGEDQLRALAEKEQQLADMQKRQAEDARRQSEQLARDTANAEKAAANARAARQAVKALPQEPSATDGARPVTTAVPSEPVRVELTVKSGSRAGGQGVDLSNSSLQQLVHVLLPAIVSELERRRRASR